MHNAALLRNQVRQEPKMHAGTDEEVLRLLSDEKWDCGIKVEGTNLYYTSRETKCVELKFPDWPGRAAYCSSRASRLGTHGNEAQFQGSLLWITYSEIGSLAPIGWKQVERMRQGFGENRSLQTARAHFFRSDELLDLEAFLVPCFVFGWDAYLVPFGSNDFFVHLSHDEYWGVISKTKEAYDILLAELKDLNPVESAGMQRRFCDSSTK
jgi:hypothetical protein